METRKEIFGMLFPTEFAHVKLDKRTSFAKKVFSFYSEREIEDIEKKKYARYVIKQKQKKELSFVEELQAFVKSFGGDSNYSKRLIIGDKHIWLASPLFEHSDYNKSIYFSNNEKNRKKAELINRLLDKQSKEN